MSTFYCRRPSLRHSLKLPSRTPLTSISPSKTYMLLSVSSHDIVLAPTSFDVILGLCTVGGTTPPPSAMAKEETMLLLCGGKLGDLHQDRSTICTMVEGTCPCHAATASIAGDAIFLCFSYFDRTQCLVF
jgi:hypothetical protein